MMVPRIGRVCGQEPEWIVADAGAAQPDFVALRTDLARLVSGTRSLVTSPSVSPFEVAKRLGLDSRRVRDVESDDWTEDFVIKVAHSHLIANHLAKLANDRDLIDRNRALILSACEEIHGLADRVRGGLIEDFRRELGVILSVVEPDVADPMLRVAFGLHELRAIHGISHEEAANAVPELPEAALREYEYAIGYSIDDLLRIREVTERFGCPNPAYEYVYDHLRASVDLLYVDPRRAQFLPERRQARVDQLTGRAPSVSPRPSPSPPPLPSEAAAAPRVGEPHIVAAIVRARNSAGETQRVAARFLAEIFNPNEYRHYANFIEQFERRGAIDSFDGVYYASLLLRRYAGFLGESRDRLSAFQGALDRHAEKLRKERAAELFARLGLRETRAGTREEIARSVDIAMSLQHARQISCLTLQAVAGAINAELGRDVISAANLFRLETVPRYNLRQLRTAQWVLAVCRMPEEVIGVGAEATAEDRDRLRHAVRAHLAEWGARPPRRVRQQGSAGRPTGPRRGVTDTGYADLIVVRAQLEAELAGAGFGVAEFFPYLEGLLGEQEKKIDATRRAELLSGLRARGSLFPQPAVGPTIDYGPEIGLRADIALAISKWRLTREPPISQKNLASAGGRYDDGFYREIRVIEEAAWPDFPPEDAIHRVLEALEAPQDLVQVVDERIVALHEEIQWRGLRSRPAAIAPVHEDPLEELNHGLEIFYWLAAIHLEHDHRRRRLPGDYVSGLAAGSGLDEDRLRVLLNPRARRWHPADTRLAGPDATLAERWSAAGMVSRAITAYATGDAVRSDVERSSGAGSLHPDEHRLLWQNIGRLAAAHTELLEQVLGPDEPRRRDRIRGSLDRVSFDNLAGGGGAEDRESLLLLLNDWQRILDETRPVGEHDPLDRTEPAPEPPWHRFLHSAVPAAVTPSPTVAPAPTETTPRSPLHSAASSSENRPDPRTDPDGWGTCGWLHRRYRNAYGLSAREVAKLIGMKPIDVDRLERGEGKRLALVAANTASLAALVCTGRSSQNLKPLQRAPEGKNGWSYAGQVIGAVRRGLGEPVVSAASSHGLAPGELAAIELGERARYNAELGRLLDFYAEFLVQQQREHQRSAPSGGESGSAPTVKSSTTNPPVPPTRPGPQLGGPPPAARPPGFRPGTHQRRPAGRSLL